MHLETYKPNKREIHPESINQKIKTWKLRIRQRNQKEAEIYRLRNIELADLYEETKKQKEEIQSTYRT